jgi:hypothetical protein
MKIYFLSFIFLFVTFFSSAAKPDFTSPVNIPIILNGNFGELRTNHFHAGIDIKTNGTTNIPVISVDDGFVSRVSVSPNSYGKALYIEHPSGYTSVYAHLLSFSPEVEKWVKEQQYKKETFAVNLYPDKDLFVVKKGAIIARSGNSGSSGGPHLHFEIRDTETEHPLNPLSFGINVTDKTKPSVSNLYVYPISPESNVAGSTAKKSYELVFSEGAFRPKNNSTIQGWGSIGFGIDAIDFLDGNWSKCGIYKSELYIDSLLIYSFVIDRLNFNDMRYVNCHIDYEEYIKNKKRIHKTYIEPGNILGIYKNTKDNGVFNFIDSKTHKVVIKIYDFFSNSSDIKFNFKSSSAVATTKVDYTELFKYDRRNSFSNDEIEIDLPLGALGNDLGFKYKKAAPKPGMYSNIHCIHNKYTPVLKPIEVSIKPVNLPEKLKDKALLAYIDNSSGKMSAIGGDYSFGSVKSIIKEFGDICIVADTIAPVISSLSIKDKKTLMEQARMRFKITDNLSGIKKFNGYIDGKWVLFEYDQKSNTVVYNFDEHISKGKNHSIKFIVEDLKNNKKEYTADFYY